MSKVSSETRVFNYLETLRLLDGNKPLSGDDFLHTLEQDLSQYELTALHKRLIGMGVAKLEDHRIKEAVSLLDQPLRSIERQRREQVWLNTHLIKIMQEVLPDRYLEEVQRRLDLLDKIPSAIS